MWSVSAEEAICAKDTRKSGRPGHRSHVTQHREEAKPIWVGLCDVHPSRHGFLYSPNHGLATPEWLRRRVLDFMNLKELIQGTWPTSRICLQPNKSNPIAYRDNRTGSLGLLQITH
jgi:hypothetical protein